MPSPSPLCLVTAREALPGQTSHTRATAAAVRVRRGLPPLFASPPFPAVHPPPARWLQPRNGGGGYPGRHPSAGSWPAVRLGRRDAGPRARLRPSWRDVRPHNLALGRLFIAEGRARGALSRWHCQPTLLPSGSFASSELSPSPSETDAVNTGQNTGRRPNHLAFPTSPLLPALGLDDGRE